MGYVEYVAVVAIANVFLGYGLAYATRTPATSLVCNKREGSLIDEELPAISLSSTDEAKPDASHNNSASNDESLAAPAKHSSEDGPRSWPEVATAILNRTELLQTTLESVLRRWESSGPAISATEAQPLAQQALEATTTWMTQATDVTDQLFATAKTLRDGKNIASCCERLWFDQLAETETALSNFSMLDWTSDITASASRLMQEVTRLNESCSTMRAKLQQLVELVYQPSGDA